MKTRLLTTIILSILLSLPITAASQSETDRQPVLVFRNTGEVNLYYSDELKGIEFVELQKEDDSAETVPAQKFVFEDKSSIISIAEIDSVTFGFRNSVVPKNGVVRMSDNAASYIEGYNGNCITFKADTPQEIIPPLGKLYYDAFTDILPYGLCGEAKARSVNDGKITLAFEEMNPKDLFEQYFYSAETSATHSLNQRAPEAEFPEELYCEAEVNGYKFSILVRTPISLTVENIVTDLIRQYYHADISLRFTPEMIFKVLSEDSDEVDYEGKSLTFYVPIAGNTLSASIDLCGFIKAVAELGLSYDFKNDIYVSWEWTRKGNENYFSEPAYSIPSGDKKSNLEIMLNGECFVGLQAKLSLGVLFDRVGVAAKFRIGPKLQGKLSMGVLQSLSRTYDQETYAKSQLSFSCAAEMTTSWYSGLLETEEHPLPFKAEFSSEPLTLNLFPEFHSRASVGQASTLTWADSQADKAVSVASYTETELETPLSIGFELASSDSDNVLQTNFEEGSNVAEGQNESLQLFADEFPLVGELRKTDPKEVCVRPVFKYLDHLIKAAPVSVASDIHYSPIIYTGIKNDAYIVSGMPLVNQMTDGKTTFIEGNLMPYAVKNDKIRSAWRKWRSEGVDNLSNEMLIGSWNGTVDGQATVIRFNDLKTGSYNGLAFSYSLGSAYNGMLTLNFDNGGKSSFLVKSLTDDTMRMSVGNTTSIYTFIKSK